MVKKRETKVAELRDQTAVSRRDLVKAGATAGLGAATLSAPGKAQAQPAPADIRWDYEADVIVCGSGGTGIVAAKRAHDLGADVLVLEQNFDIGGKLSHNGGLSSFGGGDAIQERDRRGLADPDGWLTAPLLPPADVTALELGLLGARREVCSDGVEISYSSPWRLRSSQSASQRTAYGRRRSVGVSYAAGTSLRATPYSSRTSTPITFSSKRQPG